MKAFLLIVENSLFLHWFFHKFGGVSLKKMNGKLLVVLFFLLLFLPCISTPEIASANPEIALSEKESAHILENIFQKYMPTYKKYRGIESTRQMETVIFNTKTGQVVEKSEIMLVRRDYFYERPEVRVLKYVKNGTEMKPAEYKYDDSQPGHLVFDENGRDNYELQVTERSIIDGSDCYKIKVTPRKKTIRHVEGFLFCRVDNLELILYELTLGKFPFGVKECAMLFSTEDMGDLNVIKTGSIQVEAHIPILFPNRKIVTRFKAIDNTPIFNPE